MYTYTDLNYVIISFRLRCEPATMISMLKLDVLSQMGSAWKKFIRVSDVSEA